jgi:hypothetical protein
MVTFHTRLLKAANNSGIPVPEEVVESFGAGKRVPVVVSLSGHTYRSTVAPYRGQYMISLSRANLEATGLVGDEDVEVTLEHDTAKRQVELSAEFAAALDADAQAKAAFEKLSYSNQSKHALSVADAKTDETRDRRIAKALAELRGE